MFHESLNWAAVHCLPAIFVCENNQYGLSTHIDKTTALGAVYQRAAAYGMPGVRVDGNNVSEVHAAMQEAVRRARAGEGPTLIEALTFRHIGHSMRYDRWQPPQQRCPDSSLCVGCSSAYPEPRSASSESHIAPLLPSLAGPFCSLLFPSFR